MQTRKQIISETILNELYTLAGLHARQAGLGRKLTPEEQAAGANPFLTPEGKPTYPTDTEAYAKGAMIYLPKARESYKRSREMLASLGRTTRNLDRFIQVQKGYHWLSPERFALVKPRIDQQYRLDTKSALRGLKIQDVAGKYKKYIHG